jgi:putative oxidoreductase
MDAANTSCPFSRVSGAWGVTALRIMIGVIFMLHGWEKLYTAGIPATTEFFGELGIPAPMVMAATVAGLELVGGLALIVGLLTRIVVVPLALDMATAIVLVHRPMGFFAADGGFELALLVLVGALALMLNGSGAFALDSFIEAQPLPSTPVDDLPDELPLAPTH